MLTLQGNGGGIGRAGQPLGGPKLRGARQQEIAVGIVQCPVHIQIVPNLLVSGGLLAGFYGLLLAIPVAACARILFDELVRPRLDAWARGERADLLPLED